MKKYEHDRVISNLEQTIMLTRCHEDSAICKALILIIDELYKMGNGSKEEP